jgi:hypothetical protein
MNTINGNFIEKSIPNTKNATIAVNISGVDATMTVEKFAAALPAPAVVAPYKVYTALLNASGGIPTPIVLENTIGNIVWTHHPFFGDGFYLATLAGAFPIKDKIYTTTALNASTGDYSPIQWFDANSLLLQNKNMVTNSGVDVLDYRRVEIRIYN